jgi:hypothetical protein
MEENPVSIVYYKLLLLTNLANKPDRGGALVIDTYTFDPGLAIGDKIEVQEWKVGVSSETGDSNQSFSFPAEVMDIQKISIRHQAFVVNILLESSDKATINQLREALLERNPGHF